MDECGFGWEELKGEGIREKPDGRKTSWENCYEEKIWDIVYYL